MAPLFAFWDAWCNAVAHAVPRHSRESHRMSFLRRIVAGERIANASDDR
jgi:hypothetical protein